MSLLTKRRLTNTLYTDERLQSISSITSVVIFVKLSYRKTSWVSVCLSPPNFNVYLALSHADNHLLLKLGQHRPNGCSGTSQSRTGLARCSLLWAGRRDNAARPARVTRYLLTTGSRAETETSLDSCYGFTNEMES